MEIESGRIISIPRIMREIKTSECRDWLRNAEIREIDTDADMSTEVKLIQNELDIDRRGRSDRAINLNDIHLIAAARKLGARVISNEIAKSLPTEKQSWNYNIPEACWHFQVECLTFDEFVDEFFIADEIRDCAWVGVYRPAAVLSLSA